VLDAHNWQVNGDGGKEAVSTSEATMQISDLITNMKAGGSW
jgi:hypothetical protein